MKSKIVQLPDSPAIPVPQPLLDACSLKHEVEVEAQGGCLVIRNPNPPRQGWEDALSSMAASGDDRLVFDDAPPTRWDEEEWEWSFPVTCDFQLKTGQIVLDQIRAVDKTRLVRRLGRIEESTQVDVLDVLARMFAK